MRHTNTFLLRDAGFCLTFKTHVETPFLRDAIFCLSFKDGTFAKTGPGQTSENAAKKGGRFVHRHELPPRFATLMEREQAQWAKREHEIADLREALTAHLQTAAAAAAANLAPLGAEAEGRDASDVVNGLVPAPIRYVVSRSLILCR